MSREVIPRSRWNAPPIRTGTMSSTRDGIFVHHTVSKSPRTKWGERREMRNLDSIARQRGYAGISYSFIIFKSGRIYEGRGKGVEGAHTLQYNDTSYGVAAAGNYDLEPPTGEMVKSFRWLRRRYLNLADKPIRGHQQVYQTACPGRFLYARIGEM